MRPWLLARATCAALLVVLCAPHSAHAEGSPAAEQFFRDGRAAMKKGEFDKARAMFAESQRLDPAPGTLLNLALAEEKLGKLAAAWEHARAAEEGLGQNDERYAVAQKLHADLEPRVPRLTLRSDKPLPDGTKIAVDDTELSTATLGVALPEDPGAHHIVIKSPTHKDFSLNVTLAERANETLTVTLGEQLSATPVTDSSNIVSDKGTGKQIDNTPREKPSTAMRTTGYVVGGIGIAGLATGTIFGLLAIDRKNTVNQHCTPTCDGPGLSAANDGKIFSTTSTIAFVAGAALLAGGITLVLIAPSAKPEASTALSIGPGSFYLSGSF